MNPKPDKLANVQAQLKGLNQRLYLKQIQPEARAGLELGVSRFQVECPNHLTTQPRAFPSQ